MVKQLKIESDITNLNIVENAIDSLTNEIGINQDNYGKILVAVLEAVNNAIVHGNKTDLKKKVEIDFWVRRNNLNVSVTDEGKGFKPKEVPDPTKPENIEAINGRGIFLMSKLADEIEFNKKGNSVTMVFKNITT
jgi:Anti-sigma regulatory factor (Ser/Thr protein kinase)